jgi:hypothetical protein
MDELTVRVAQQVAILSERGGWSRQCSVPSDDELLGLMKSHVTSTQVLLKELHSKNRPSFFPSFDSIDVTVQEFRNRWPEAEQQTMVAANKIVEGKFDLLGLHNLDFGKTIDWHFEPTSGKRSPLCHWSQLNYLDAGVVGDKKVVWELNRHQYFHTLGRAYLFNHDEQYADVFITHLLSWMDNNPPKLGINWASSLEIAFRSIAWLWALQFFQNSSAVTPDILLRIVKFIYLNASHLETYLSTYFSPNTHLTGEALGLFYIGLLFPEFKDAERWRDLGLKILVAQIPQHVKPDGVYFEQASYYHRYTADFYLHLLILLRRNNMVVPRNLEPTLELLLNHLMFITRPDGTTPFFGDDDGGRLVMLDSRPANDFRSLLSTGAALFNRGDYKFVAGEIAEETLWLLGAEAVRSLGQIGSNQPDKESVGFPDGGYYVMRDGWSPSANYLLFDCGPHGTLNCGHAHADALAVDLAANGRTLLVDPGTFTYTGASGERNWFRSSAAHNTLTIDGQSSSIAADVFSWKKATQCERLAWIDHPSFTYVAGRHSGYARLAEPGIHTRSILFLKHNYWLVRDRVEITGRHEIEQWFHFDAGIIPTQLQIVSFAENGQWRMENGWVSHCYAEKTAAPVSVFSAIAHDDFEISTFLIPYPPEEVTVNRVEMLNGCGFEVRSQDWKDLVITRDSGSGALAQSSSLVSDFDCAWLRFDQDDSSPRELLTLGGQNLHFEGKQILALAERVAYSWLTKDPVQGSYVRN